MSILTGRRPVSLIGFSFGARVIYKCLKEIARHQREWLEKKENDRNLREPASIIEDVILMGLPNHYNRDTWCDIRRVVNGRLVNCYSKNDWILQIMFQLKKISVKPVCGTIPIDIDRVESYDVSQIIQNHGDYCVKVSEILKMVGFSKSVR
mmetsp:Transcript_15602/g.20345  ORF Transcript_15602/g.20345 Transcript_15602/m.20345 type:complete len:151 (+) Transcript_15602:1648-2100(+)